ncbi:MAG: hypothetical protein EOP04_02435 [Proteobacteria bacterium]|nr:MAG: hypothetical protein EOP04_02435 [Pseudomonadota bacterium]
MKSQRLLLLFDKLNVSAPGARFVFDAKHTVPAISDVENPAMTVQILRYHVAYAYDSTGGLQDSLLARIQEKCLEYKSFASRNGVRYYSGMSSGFIWTKKAIIPIYATENDPSGPAVLIYYDKWLYELRLINEWAWGPLLILFCQNLVSNDPELNLCSFPIVRDVEWTERQLARLRNSR